MASRHVLLFVHDYMSNKLPNSFNGCFPTNSDSSRIINLHHHTEKASGLSVMKFSPRQPIGFLATLWNKWNKLIPENASRTQTKRIIKSILLQDYPDVVRSENMRLSECHFNFN